MNKYGLTAIKTVENCKIIKDPIAAWELAVTAIFETKSTREKRCPRSTFLSLCETGVVKNIPEGNYAPRVKENKVYALKAMDILRKRNTKPEKIGVIELWELAQNQNKRYNSQMDVLLALWNNGLIEFK